ncbi:MAG: hypothetical protein EKE20_03130 [Candidatus Symbiopectobacterium sp. Dall1.0]|nr:hypothetical protein [Candidatus Symbiopectobacterium sp. Dall1.0]
MRRRFFCRHDLFYILIAKLCCSFSVVNRYCSLLIHRTDKHILPARSVREDDILRALDAIGKLTLWNEFTDNVNVALGLTLTPI